MQPLQQQQAPPPRQSIPAEFSPVEAQANLEQRWTNVCQQGMTPTPQCKQQTQTDTCGEVEAGSDFLSALKAAATAAASSSGSQAGPSNSADAAWDEE